MSDLNRASNDTRLNDQFIVQRAGIDDLPAILSIYNQSIAGKQATANLVAVSVAERMAWFAEHFNSLTRPIYVVKTSNKNEQTANIMYDHAKVKAIDSFANPSANKKRDPSIIDASVIVAWGSFSDLYARSAYHISSEISIYLHKDYHGQGLGSLLTRWMLTQTPSLNIQNVVALIFAHNKPSLGLFTKLGFEQWGYMPQVCDMQGFTADVVMLGKAVAANR